MPKIDEMYAFVMEDAGPEDEGIMGFLAQDGTWMPMVGADMARVDVLRPIADQIAVQMDKPYKVLRFSVREEL